MMGTLVQRTAYVLVSIFLVGCSDSPKEGSSVVDNDQTAKRPPCVSQVRDEKPHESDEIETEIVRMVGQLSETTFDAKSLCDKIAQVPDEKMRGQRGIRRADGSGISYAPRYDRRHRNRIVRGSAPCGRK